MCRLGRELSPVRARPKSRVPSEDNSSPEEDTVGYPGQGTGFKKGLTIDSYPWPGIGDYEEIDIQVVIVD